MQPYVLYYCPCEQRSTSARGSSAHHPNQDPLLSDPPNLPAYSPASRYAFHQLESLYFCDECDQIRCNRCVTVDVTSYFCPNCLFEVPGASVKAEKNRCARNCFVCPCCTRILSVLASDAEETDLLSSTTSQGQPPYFLGCSFCKWDSKSIGLVFEKPTGVSLQLQRQEDNAYDVQEFERLKDHFDPFIKTQTQAAAVSAAVGVSQSSTGSGKSTSMTATGAGSGGKTSRSHAANDAASAALRKSKLLRDLPSLTSSKHLSSQAGLSDSSRAGQTERDELKPYEALTSWNTGRSTSHIADQIALGAMGKRERHRHDYLAKVNPTEGNPAASVGEKITSLAQRSNTVFDQPLRVADLRPTRVPLRAKQSKRCPTCKHIVIKPDLKAASNRFKIKLVAMNYLPEFQVSVALEQPFLALSTAGANNKNESSDVFGSLSTGSSLRKAPASSIGPSGGSTLGSSFLPATLTSTDVDTSRLLPGQTYSFQLSVTNPLDDPLRVKITFARVLPPSSTSAAFSDDVQELRDSRYIFASSDSPAKASQASVFSSAPVASSYSDVGVASRTKSRFGWRVYPSTIAFPLNAFNEVWELEESTDLLNDKAVMDETTAFSFDQDNAYEQGESDLSDVDDSVGTILGHGESAEPIAKEEYRRTQGLRRDARANLGGQRKPFAQKGHTTTLPLDLTISSKNAPPSGHPIEVAMYVTFSYIVDDSTAPAKGTAQSARKDFQFWTSVRLGTVAS